MKCLITLTFAQAVYQEQIHMESEAEYLEKLRIEAEYRVAIEHF